MRFLINGSNLHSGGGVQVAASLITELAALRPPEQLDVLVSTVLDKNLKSTRPDISAFRRYVVHDVRGISALWRLPATNLRSYDAVLTIFGPLYSVIKPRKSVMGFAQPWIIYPDNELAARMTSTTRWKTRLKFRIQAAFFSRADALIVELDHVKRRLVARHIMAPERIKVVSNTLSTIYLDRSKWEEVFIPRKEADLRLGFVGRNYPHKNTEVFPRIWRLLKENFGIEACFYVTFTDEEWRACSTEFRDCCVNIGPLSVAQCPLFYENMDGVIFPSLLECFSATPLEAMAMNLPLFASDRPFIRDVCGDHANYFDPLSPRSAAQCIAEYFRSTTKSPSPRLIAAKNRALAFPSARSRAQQVLACLRGSVASEIPSCRQMSATRKSISSTGKTTDIISEGGDKHE